MNQEQFTNPLYFVEETNLSNHTLIENSHFTQANGHILQQADFEEFYSGSEVLGTTMAGIYCIENDVQQLSVLPNWISIYVRLNAETLDVAKCEMVSYKRIMNIQEGYLERKFEVISECKHHLEITVQRFLSLANKEIGAIKYKVKSLNFEGRISFYPLLDGNEQLVDGTTKEPEWNVLQSKTQTTVAHLWIQTRKTNLQVCQAMTFDFTKNNSPVKINPTKIEKQKVAGFSVGTDVKAGESVCVFKYVAHLNSLHHPYKELTVRACNVALEAKNNGWDELFLQNKMAWIECWKKSDAALSTHSPIIQESIRTQFNTLPSF
jgi:maltose phosphorylase